MRKHRFHRKTNQLSYFECTIVPSGHGGRALAMIPEELQCKQAFPSRIPGRICILNGLPKGQSKSSTMDLLVQVTTCYDLPEGSSGDRHPELLICWEILLDALTVMSTICVIPEARWTYWKYLEALPEMSQTWVSFWKAA